MRGRKTILTEKQHHDILKLVQEQPDITMKEIVETLHLPVGDEAVRRFLIKQGYTYKSGGYGMVLESLQCTVTRTLRKSFRGFQGCYGIFRCI